MWGAKKPTPHVTLPPERPKRRTWRRDVGDGRVRRGESLGKKKLLTSSETSRKYSPLRARPAAESASCRRNAAASAFSATWMALLMPLTSCSSCAAVTSSTSNICSPFLCLCVHIIGLKDHAVDPQHGFNSIWIAVLARGLSILPICAQHLDQLRIFINHFGAHQCSEIKSSVRGSTLPVRMPQGWREGS